MPHTYWRCDAPGCNVKIRKDGLDARLRIEAHVALHGYTVQVLRDGVWQDLPWSDISIRSDIAWKDILPDAGRYGWQELRVDGGEIKPPWRILRDGNYLVYAQGPVALDDITR